MKLIKPVKMENGQIVTRGADYFILDARAVLDTYRGDQQTRRKISIKGYRKILAGILHALAEGRHLDFSNTGLGMPEGGDGWCWVKNFTGFNYKKTEWEVLGYLTPVEIYELVHRASPQQCDPDGQVDEVAKRIASLSVA